MEAGRIEYNMVRPHQVLDRFDKPNVSELPQRVEAHPSQLWGFKSAGGLGPNAYTHGLFADFDLAGQK